MEWYWTGGGPQMDSSWARHGHEIHRRSTGDEQGRVGRQTGGG